MTNPAHLAGNEPDLDHNDETHTAVEKLHAILNHLEGRLTNIWCLGERMDRAADELEASIDWPEAILAAEADLRKVEATVIEIHNALKKAR